MHSDTAVSPQGCLSAPRFGEFELDFQARELNRDGRRIRLQEQPFQVLVMLLGRAGKVVTREELRQKLWPSSVYVDFDHGLNNAIGRLREALGDVAATPRYIETLPRLGYRFIAPIADGRVPAGTHTNDECIEGPLEPGAAAPSSSAKEPRSRRRSVIAAAVIAALAVAAVLLIGPVLTSGPTEETPPATAGVEAPSIAVLPFDDMSATQDQAWFSDGITEEILSRLTRSGGLRVISRTSSFSFRGRPLDVREIGAKLDVTHVLEGSVRRSGDRIRITAQLIEVNSNSHVWSETYDHTVGDLFAVQDEIAVAVATALEVSLASGAPRSAPPASVEAYESLMRSEFFYDRRAPGDIDRSVKYLEEAVSIDPRYAKAWAALAGAYAMQAWNGHPAAAELRVRQGKAARKAVELDPNLAVAHARLGQYYLETAGRRRAEPQLRKAFALDPDEPLVAGYTCSIAVLRGELNEAIEVQRRVVARDPLSAADRINLGVLLLAAGRPDDAIVVFREMLELNPEVRSQAEVQIGRTLLLQQRYDQAHATFAHLPDGETRDYGLALLHRSPEHAAEADAALSRLSAGPGTTDNIRLAEVYAFRDMTNESFAALQEIRKKLEGDPVFASTHVLHLQLEMGVSPFLTALHSDPRWAALMADPG